MKTLKLLIFIGLVLAQTSCSTKKQEPIQVIITSHVSLASLPSASGISFYKSNIYIVGDDSPWIYRMDKPKEATQLIKLSAIDSIVNGRTPKKIKADFECMEQLLFQAEDYLLVLSSGSDPITRDTASLIALETGEIIVKKNIRPLYEKIKMSAGITGDDEINIEGLAVSKTEAYLFHRGNISGNIVISIGLKSLVSYLRNEQLNIPDFTVYHFELPEYEGTKSGFSGACMLPGNRGVLFTASMEKTDNVYDDGQIAGSYMGIISLEGLSKGEFRATLVRSKQTVLKKKLEGVTIKSATNNKMVILAVSDNDDGTSDLFEMEVSF